MQVPYSLWPSNEISQPNDSHFRTRLLCGRGSDDPRALISTSSAAVPAHCPSRRVKHRSAMSKDVPVPRTVANSEQNQETQYRIISQGVATTKCIC